MTTHTIYQQPEGEVILMTNPGAAPIVYLNGVIQTPGSYYISGHTIIFDVPQKPWQWKKHYTWLPKRINGKWYWFKHVYRYWCLGPGGGFWRYGDEFDILKES